MISKKRLFSFMLGDGSDAPYTGFTLPKEHGLDSQKHSLDTMKVVFKVKSVIYDSILTIDATQQSLRQHDMTGCSFLQDQQQVPAESKDKLCLPILLRSKH